MTGVDLDNRGQTIRLLPGFAAYWVERRTLLVADLHLGRSGAFRASSLALPTGSDADDLRRLSAHLLATSAERVIILGDLFHDRAGMTADTRALVDDWLTNAPAEVWLVEGNHDRRCRPYGLSAPLRICPNAIIDGPFQFTHDPQPTANANGPHHPSSEHSEAPGAFTICGHLHPGVTLKDAAGCRHRAKAFWRREHSLVLPAYGALTSHAAVPDEPNSRLYPVTNDEVLELPGMPSGR